MSALKVEKWDAEATSVGKMDQKTMACPLKHSDGSSKSYTHIDTNWLPAWRVLRQSQRGDRILITDEDANSSKFFDKLQEAEQAACDGLAQLVESLSKVNKDVDYVELDADKHINSSVNDTNDKRSAFIPLGKTVDMYTVPTTDDAVKENAQHVNAIDHIAEEPQQTKNGNYLLNQPENKYIRLVLCIDRVKFNPNQKYGKFVSVPIYIDQLFTATATEDWRYRSESDSRPTKAIKVDD